MHVEPLHSNLARCDLERWSARDARLVGVLEEPGRLARQYLRLVDRLLPERVVGFYLVGSSALSAFVPGRSDVDFVAVVDRGLSEGELRRVRAAQLGSGVRTTIGALRAGHVALPGTVNGAYVRAEDMSLPVTAIRPVVSHVGAAFQVNAAFDVNPVVWKELAERGVSLRGPSPSLLGLDPEPARLRDWNAENLDGYWSRWADRSALGRRTSSRMLPTGWVVAWGTLGAPRLHRTIATGEVVSKEAAGEYALDVFDREWHAIILDGLAFWRLEPSVYSDSRRGRIARAGEFVAEVVRSARDLAN